MSKLLPCPFCGSNIENVTHSSSCYFMSESYFRQTIDDAWNHRVYPPEVEAVLTAAKRVRQTPFYKRVALIDAVMNLNSAIRDLEEIEAIDETQ